MCRICRLGTVLLLALISLPGQAREHRSASGVLQEIIVGGTTRTFILHTPMKLEIGDVGAPLIIALHGGATHARAMQRFTGLDKTADQHGFMVVYPNGTGRIDAVRTWNCGVFECYAKSRNVDDVTFIKVLIEYMVETHSVDPRRVYVAGISNGAMMAYRLAAEIPERIAAIAAVAGTLDVDPSAIRAPMPILHFHGTADEHIPYDGGRGAKTFRENTHRSVSDTIASWVRINGADATPKEESMPDRRDDGTQVVKYTYETATGSDNIVLYKIIGGGHTWPGRPRLERQLGIATRDVSANDVMWRFFKNHSALERQRRPTNRRGKNEH